MQVDLFNSKLLGKVSPIHDIIATQTEPLSLWKMLNCDDPFAFLDPVTFCLSLGQLYLPVTKTSARTSPVIIRFLYIKLKKAMFI